MRRKKILVIIIALALLLACIVALRLRRDKPIGASVSETSRLIGGPAFEVQVELPAFNSGRAPWEIPGVILGYDRGPRFDQASPRAQIGKIAPHHIELSADGGWDLLIETDREGRLAQETHVAFPVKLGGRPLKFNCRPADLTVGYLHTTARTGSDELEGSFQLEVAICKNAVSGKTAAWPYQPLKVRGTFAGLKNLAAARRFGYGTNANSFINPNAVEQIVGREPRKRVSQAAFVNPNWCHRAAASTPPLCGTIDGVSGLLVHRLVDMSWR